MTSRPGLGPLAVAAALALSLLACAPGTPRTTFPPLGSTPRPAGDATAATRQAVVAALAGAGLQAVDASRAYRPPEGALLTAAPRSVLQVTLPNDPTHGFIVIYALGSPEAASAAAADHAAYVSSGPGGIQYPPGTQFVLRVAGSNVVFFSWSPGNSPDPQTPAIAQALATIGSAVQVPG